MGEKLVNKQGCFTLLEVYQNLIAPKLKEIDLFLKTGDDYITSAQAAQILDESEKEIIDIMANLNIGKIDKKSFIRIMEKGSSPICGFFRRELACGSPYVYSRQDIAYIYKLDIKQLNLACDSLHIKEITPYTLPKVFSHIYIM